MHWANWLCSLCLIRHHLDKMNMVVMLQAAGALGISLEAEEEEEDECTPTVNAASIPASSPQIQNGLNYFKYDLRLVICNQPQTHHVAHLSPPSDISTLMLSIAM